MIADRVLVETCPACRYSHVAGEPHDCPPDDHPDSPAGLIAAISTELRQRASLPEVIPNALDEAVIALGRLDVARGVIGRVSPDMTHRQLAAVVVELRRVLG